MPIVNNKKLYIILTNIYNKTTFFYYFPFLEYIKNIKIFYKMYVVYKKLIILYMYFYNYVHYTLF
jgi:hypothetical protein